MYAIQNIKTGKFVCGTDHRYSGGYQKTSNDQMITYEYLTAAKIDFSVRKCGMNYRIVKLAKPYVTEVIDLDYDWGYDI